jgi:hypothetical protein
MIQPAHFPEGNKQWNGRERYCILAEIDHSHGLESLGVVGNNLSGTPES